MRVICRPCHLGNHADCTDHWFVHQCECVHTPTSYLQREQERLDLDAGEVREFINSHADVFERLDALAALDRLVFRIGSSDGGERSDGRDRG